MRTIRLASMLLLLAMLHGCRPQPMVPEGPSSIVPITSAKHFQSALATHDVVLVDFYADWCAPCHQLRPTIEKIARDYEKRVHVVSVDHDAHGDLINTYGIQAIPTVIIFQKGQLIKRLVGVYGEQSYTEVLESLELPQVDQADTENLGSSAGASDPR